MGVEKGLPCVIYEYLSKADGGGLGRGVHTSISEHRKHLDEAGDLRPHAPKGQYHHIIKPSIRSPGEIDTVASMRCLILRLEKVQLSCNRSEGGVSP